MKKACCWLCTIIVLLIFSSCNQHAGERPNNQSNTRWVAEEFDCYYIVSDGNRASGTITYNGTKTNFYLSYLGAKVNAVAEDEIADGIYPEDVIFYGSCRFYPDKMIITNVDVNRPDLMDENITRITLVKDEGYTGQTKE